MRDPLILLVLCTLLGACRKEDSSLVPDENGIHQDLKVLFDKAENRTRAYATFHKGGPFGVRLELTGGSSITFNGQPWISYTELDPYFYRWNTSGLQPVLFRFDRAGVGIFENTIALADTHDVAVPAGLTLSLGAGAQVAWVGRPLEAGERMVAEVRQGSSSSATVQVNTAGAHQVAFTAQQLSALAIGSADLVLTRTRELPLQQANTPAGGRRVVEVETRGPVTVVP